MDKIQLYTTIATCSISFSFGSFGKAKWRMNVSIAACIAIVQSRNQLEVYNLMAQQTWLIKCRVMASLISLVFYEMQT